MAKGLYLSMFASKKRTPSKNKEKYEITLTRPVGVSVADMTQYIQEALSHWCKGGCPTDPAWRIGDYHISVKRERKP